MAYTKSASKLQNFPDIATSFGGKFAYKPHFSFLFSIFNHFSSISPEISRPNLWASTPKDWILSVDSRLYGTDLSIIVLYDVFSALSSHPFSSNKVKGVVLEAHHWWHQSALPPSVRGEKWLAKDCPLYHSQTCGWWSSQAL